MRSGSGQRDSNPFRWHPDDLLDEQIDKLRHRVASLQSTGQEASQRIAASYQTALDQALAERQRRINRENSCIPPAPVV